MKRIKDTIAALVYRVITLVIKLIPASAKSDRLLILKPDEIGDYVIFRNLLAAIRQSATYRNFHITLVANESCKAIFNRYDAPYVDEVIWLNKKKYNRDMYYRFSLLKSIRKSGSSHVLNFIFSRGFSLDDGMAFVATGNVKLAMNPDKSNQGENAVNVDKLIYTDIIESGGADVFDSVRNKVFLSKITGEEHITIDTKFPGMAARNPHNAFGIFLGAGNPERNWPVTHFVKAAAYLQTKYGMDVLVFGGPPDADNAALFVQQFGGRATNYAAKTSLTEYIDLLQNIRFLICVDTGPLHIAVASGCPVFGLFSGRYYKRYSPYPIEITDKFFPIYPGFIDPLIQNNDPVLFNPFKTMNNTIYMIPPEKVTDNIDRQMAAGKI